MKLYLSAALVALSCPACGKDARVEIFESATDLQFLLLVPEAASKGRSAQPASRLRTAAGHAVIRPIARNSQLGQTVRVTGIPSWMKRGRSGALPTRVASYPARPDADCPAVAFFPRDDLAAPVQSRRRIHFADVAAAACRAGIPVRLFDALVVQESGYLPFARSNAGAIGMAQLMPATASYLGVSNPWDPAENLNGGARYLREQYDRYGAWHLALAAYNAGPGNVEKHGGVPPFAQTRRYVRAILGPHDTSRSAPASFSEHRPNLPVTMARIFHFERKATIPKD